VSVNRRQFGQLELSGVERGTRGNPHIPHPLSMSAPHLVKENARHAAQRRQRAPEVLNQTKSRFVRDAAEGQPSIRFPSGVLESVLATGEIRNQFQTDRSEGSFNPGYRAMYEHHAFGIDEEAGGEERPVYGYMHRAGDTQGATRAQSYGDVRAVLDPSVRNRSTVTAGDSLGRSLPLPVNEVAKGRVPLHALGPHTPSDYTELQVHGGVNVHTDVDHLEFGTEHGPSVKRFVDEAGVPWRQMRTERYTQHPLSVVGPRREEMHTRLRREMGGGSIPPERAEHILRMEVFGTTVHDKVSSQQFEVDRSEGFRSHYFASRSDG
jgi:hypothetical protein